MKVMINTMPACVGEFGVATGTRGLGNVDGVRRLRGRDGGGWSVYDNSVQSEILAGQHFASDRAGVAIRSCSRTSGNSSADIFRLHNRMASTL